MSNDRSLSAETAHRLTADASVDRFVASASLGSPLEHDPASLVLNGASMGHDLLVGAPGAAFATPDAALAGPHTTPVVSDYGMMPLDNTKPHKTVAEAADQLTRGGYNWNSTTGQALTITYAFRQDAPSTMPQDTTGFSQFNANQIAATKIALQAWADVANITFVQVTDADAYTNNATILYGNYGAGAKGAAAFATPPGYFGGGPHSDPSSGDGDVWINNSFDYNSTPNRDEYGSQVLLHETGHALGLLHPGDYNAAPDHVANYADDALYYEDDVHYTVMSYFSETNTGGDFFGDSAESPLMDDIAAIQKQYGANTSAFNGNTTYGFNATTGSDYRPYYDASLSDHALIFCAYDTGGVDTFDFSQYVADQRIDLNTGRDHFSDVGGGLHNVSIFDGTVIENAVGGAGADNIIGNDASNQLTGNAGADTLVGGAGDDTLIGGSGSDNLNGGDGNDVVYFDGTDAVVTGGAGEDRVIVNADVATVSSVSLLDGGHFDLQIEDLQATGSRGIELDGSNIANKITGNDGANLIKALDGADSVEGGKGADTVYAGVGDDTVWGGSSTDLALVDGGDKIYGEDGNDLLNGNLGNDTIDGGVGNDTIYGGANDDDSLIGGAGNDSIDGGSGNDTIDGGADNNILIGGAGADLIRIQAGSNSVDGGADNDELDFSFGTSTASVTHSGSGAGTISWGGGQTSSFTGVEHVDVNIGGKVYDLGASGQIFYVKADGLYTVHGGAATDILVLDYSTDGSGLYDSGLTAGSGGYSGSFGTPYNSVTFDGIDAFQITCSSGNDSINVASAPATVNLGGGDDVINSGTAIDSLIGGAGYDGWTADLSAEAVAVNLDLTAGTYSGAGSASGFEYVGSFATGSKNDIIKTGAGGNSELISTNAGSDTVTTYNGFDTVHLGSGTDTLIMDFSADGAGAYLSVTDNGAAGFSGSLGTPYNNTSFDGAEIFKITTSSGNDSITTANALATINTGGGDDFINSGTAVDSLTAGAGYDGWTADLSAQAVAVNLDLQAGTYAGAGSASGFDYVGSFASGSKNDFIKTGTGGNSELISTNAGNDTVMTYNGIDTVHLGSGVDTLIIDFSADGAGAYMSITDNGAAGFSGSLGTPYNNTSFDGAEIFNITTSGGSDNISTGTALATINTAGGDDFINSGTSVDSLIAGAGYDGWTADLSAQAVAVILDLQAGTYSGAGSASGFEYVGSFASGAMNDVIKTGAGGNSELISTNAGNDTVTTYNGFDNVHLGSGTDTLIMDFSGDGAGAYLSVTDNGAAGFSGSLGTPYNNTSFDGAEIFNITTASGSDYINTGAALATINTGAGDDVINSGTALDSIVAGAGTDGWSADLSAQTAAISLDLSTGVYTGPGVATGFEYVGAFSTGSGNDVIKTVSGGHTETISTNGGNDTVTVVDGRDVVHMGAGSDTLIIDFSYDGAGIGSNLTDNGGAGFSGGYGSPYDGVSFDGVETFRITTGVSSDSILTGAGDDQIATGAGVDTLNGGAGADTLIGGAGADSMYGGAGNDLFLVDDAGDHVFENAGEGTDTVQTLVTYTLGDNVENLVLDGSAKINGTGNGGDNLITGNGANNVLSGLGGADTLDGGAGADSLIGGGGNDTYIVDSAADVITETASGGVDTVRATYSYTLGATLENLVLTGAAQTGTGNGGANLVTGNALDNTLDGGAGADTLVGGLGNDIFKVDDAGDVVTEAAGGGTDTIFSSVSYTIAANVDALVLTGAANINGSGDATANRITGNDGANSLAGGNGADTLTGGLGDDTLNGGLSADSLVGGAGNDVFVIDNVFDAVTELVNEGIDLVQSSISYVLGANVENLVLTGSAVSGTGNALANEIDGDSSANSLVGGNGADTLNGAIGNDTLDGGALSDVLNGGTGADSMIGGSGNDTFTVDNAGDVVVELAGGGTDTVQSSVTYTLGANVENLALTGNLAIDGTGNDLANTLKGSAKDNVLEGGLGDDVIVGGKGYDTACYAHATGGVTVSLAAGAVNSGAAGSDAISSVEALRGSDFADVLTGSGKGNALDGGAGSDTLVGGGGADVLTGGADADRFVFTDVADSATKTPDRITDLANADVIDLHLIDANAGTPTDDAFSLVSAFTHQAGQLLLSYDTGTNTTLVQGDTDGDGKANIAIMLDGDHRDFTNFAL